MGMTCRSDRIAGFVDNPAWRLVVDRSESLIAESDLVELILDRRGVLRWRNHGAASLLVDCR